MISLTLASKEIEFLGFKIKLNNDSDGPLELPIEKTDSFPPLILLDQDFPYIERDFVDGLPDQCIFVAPKKYSKRAKVDLKRLEYSTELL